MIEIVALERLLRGLSSQRGEVILERLVLNIAPLLIDIFLVIVVRAFGDEWGL